MHSVLRTPNRVLLSMSNAEIAAVSNALNEVCNGVHLSEPEFETRLGVSRQTLLGMLSAITAEPHASRLTGELVDVWEDHGAVMIQALNVYGDPVELGETEARKFAAQLEQAIQKAS